LTWHVHEMSHYGTCRRRSLYAIPIQDKKDIKVFINIGEKKSIS